MPDALATVRLWWTQANDGGAGLSDGFLVSRAEHEHGALGVFRNLGLDALGELERGRMGQTQVEVNRATLELAAVTSAVELENPLVALGGALHHGGDERSAQTLQSCMVGAGGVRGDDDCFAVLLGDDTLGKQLRE